MEELIKKIYTNTVGRYLVLPLLLILFWLLFTLLFIINFDTSFSIWSYNHPNSDFTKLTFNPLYKGNKISGEFKAKDNNLGIVSIRFQTFIRPPYSLEDIYLFRIKEKGKQKWYYQNTYKSGLVYDIPFFPFGFPQIQNSKGKTYEFEVISLNGNYVNALEISDRKPILVSKYKYSREVLVRNKTALINFLFTKINNSMQNPDVWFSSFIYFLPFLFYLFWISIFEKYVDTVRNRLDYFFDILSKNKYISPILRVIKKFVFHLDLIIIFIVLIDILVIQLKNDIAYIVLIALWIITLEKYKMSSKYSFFTAFTILFLSPLFLVFKEEPTSEKASIWGYMFLVAGTIQYFIENKKSSKLDVKTGK